MSKKLLITIFLCAIITNHSFSQSKWNTFFKGNNYSIMLTMEPFGPSLGYLASVSRNFISKKHIESSLGLAFQNSYSLRTKFKKNMSPNTRVIDYSLLLVNDWKYFPFKRKNLFLEVGLYSGITRSTTKGNLRLPMFNIDESYYNRHTYFNYGSIQSLGCRIKTKYDLSAFSMISLKGIFDKGRNRPAEVDSRFFIGIKFTCTFQSE